MKKLFLSSALAMMASASFAQSAPECGPTTDVRNFLTSEFGEESVFQGLDKEGNIVEVWTGEESWSLLVTLPKGVSCFLTDGEAWQGPKPDL